MQVIKPISAESQHGPRTHVGRKAEAEAAIDA